MPGQMGNKRVTVQGLEIVSVDAEKGVLVIKGAVPGANGGDVIVRPSVKSLVKGINVNLKLLQVQRLNYQRSLLVVSLTKPWYTKS